MRVHRWPIPALGMGFALAVVPGYAIHQGGASLSLDHAIQQALLNNPGLAEVKSRAEAMAAIPSQAGSLPDPTLSLDALYLPTDSFDVRQDDFTMLEVGISQAIPFPGKLGLQEQAAEFEAAGAAQTAEDARLKLVRDVKLRWWQLFYLERTLEIIGETEGLLRQVVEAAAARYRSGEGMQQDVLQAQLELSRLGEEKLIHSAMHHTESARLNALLNRPATAMVYLPHEESGDLPEVAAEESLDRQAEETRPLLGQKRRSLDAAQSRLELAEKDYYPDFTLRAAYDYRDRSPSGQRRSDFASFGVSLNLPLYAAGKQAKAVDQRQSELLKARYGLEDALRKVQADIAGSLAEYRRAKAHHALLRHDIIPLAQQTIASLQANYDSGRTGMVEVLRAVANLRTAEIQSWLAYAQAQQALARLAAAAGKEGL